MNRRIRSTTVFLSVSGAFLLVAVAAPSVTLAATDGKPYVRARQLELSADTTAALEAFEKIVSSRSDFADLAMLGVARCHRRLGNLKQARDNLQKVLKEFPKSPVVPHARVELARTLLEMKSFDKSVEQLERALGTYPSSVNRPEALYLLGTAYEKMGKQDKARWTFERACKLAPESSDALLCAKRLAQTGNPSEGLGAIDVFITQKRWGLTIHLCEQLLAATESNAELRAKVLLGLARAYAGAEKPDDALRIYMTIANRSGSSSAARALLEAGMLNDRVGRRAQAVRMWQRIHDTYPGAPEAAEAHWELARAFERGGRRKEAIAQYEALARDHPMSPLRSDALFRAGVLTYLSRGYPGSAELFLESARDTSSRTVQDALYWAGKAYRAAGKSHIAARYFSQAAAVTPTGFYGYRAWAALHELSPVRTRRDNRIRLGKGWQMVLPSTERPATLRLARTVRPQNLDDGASKLAQRARLLLEDQLPEAGWDLEELPLCAGLSNPVRLAQTFLYAGAYDKCVNVAEGIVVNAAEEVHIPELLRYLYPVAYQQEVQKLASKYGIDPLLATAVMREESHFDRMRVSKAGATGLMQIMPETGRSLASKIGIRGYSNDSLFDCHINLRLGAVYLGALSKEFRGNTVLVLAAYNAGSGNVNRWLAKRDRATDLDIFVETIPLDETRRYVKKVLGAYGNYLQLK